MHFACRLCALPLSVAEATAPEAMLGRRGGVGLWAGAVHLHHLVKVVSVGVLPCVAATFPFLVNKYPGEDSLSLCKHAVTS